MKALSIQQPWAYLICQGHKDIENRDWNTVYRGLVLIHAGKQVDGKFFANDGKTVFLPYAERVCGNAVAAIMPQNFEDYERGGIVGYATLKEVVTKSDSPWFRGKYGFVLTQRHSVDFIPLRGQLGLFDVPSEIEAQIKREWEAYRLEGD